MLEPADPGAALPRAFSLEGKVALVTGASGGLGHRFARVLAAAGATVYATARRKDRLAELAEGSSRIRALRMDVTDGDDVASAIAQVVDEAGSLGVVVNNAGITAPERAESESIDTFGRVLDVNVTGAFRVAQAAARAVMLEEGGTIVNIASVLGLVAASPLRNASYCSSKGAVINLTRELGVQWARRGIRVNAIAPGFFPSDMTTEMFADPTTRSWLESNLPMRRVGRAEELDGALVFLASDASSYMTGQVLVVDGGWTAR